MDFVNRTEAALDHLPSVAAIEVPKKAGTPLGECPAEQYLKHAAEVETPNVRGTATFFAEQAQDLRQAL